MAPVMAYYSGLLFFPTWEHLEVITGGVNWLNGIVWGVPILLLIPGVGLFLTVGLKLVTILKISLGFKLLWQGRIPGGEGEISPFNALMTSLAATIGTVNIASVATANFLSGPGAILWMWMIALVGIARKFAEALLAVHYREEDANGKRVGGPMYYIKNGLGAKWNWMVVAFALFASIAGFGIGNMVQANSIANALNANFTIPECLTGIVLVVLVGAVLLGGIELISTVAGKLVPIMAIAYMAAGTLVLARNAEEIPAAFSLIFTHAFTTPLIGKPTGGNGTGGKGDKAGRGVGDQLGIAHPPLTSEGQRCGRREDQHAQMIEELPDIEKQKLDFLTRHGDPH